MDANQFFNQANICFANENYIEAARNFSLAIEMNRESFQFWSHRAATFYMMGKHNLALGDIETAIKLHGNEHVPTTHRHGQILFALGRYLEARECFRMNVKKDWNDHRAKAWKRKCDSKLSGSTQVIPQVKVISPPQVTSNGKGARAADQALASRIARNPKKIDEPQNYRQTAVPEKRTPQIKLSLHQNDSEVFITNFVKNRQKEHASPINPMKTPRFGKEDNSPTLLGVGGPRADRVAKRNTRTFSIFPHSPQKRRTTEPHCDPDKTTTQYSGSSSYASRPSSLKLSNSSCGTPVPAVNLKRAFSSMNPNHYNDKKYTNTTKSILPTGKSTNTVCGKKGTKTQNGGEDDLMFTGSSSYASRPSPHKLLNETSCTPVPGVNLKLPLRSNDKKRKNTTIFPTKAGRKSVWVQEDDDLDGLDKNRGFNIKEGKQEEDGPKRINMRSKASEIDTPKFLSKALAQARAAAASLTYLEPTSSSSNTPCAPRRRHLPFFTMSQSGRCAPIWETIMEPMTGQADEGEEAEKGEERGIENDDKKYPHSDDEDPHPSRWSRASFPLLTHVKDGALEDEDGRGDNDDGRGEWSSCAPPRLASPKNLCASSSTECTTTTTTTTIPTTIVLQDIPVSPTESRESAYDGRHKTDVYAWVEAQYAARKRKEAYEAAILRGTRPHMGAAAYCLGKSTTDYGGGGGGGIESSSMDVLTSDSGDSISTGSQRKARRRRERVRHHGAESAEKEQPPSFIKPTTFTRLGKKDNSPIYLSMPRAHLGAKQNPHSLVTPVPPQKRRTPTESFYDPENVSCSSPHKLLNKMSCTPVLPGLNLKRALTSNDKKHKRSTIFPTKAGRKSVWVQEEDDLDGLDKNRGFTIKEGDPEKTTTQYSVSSSSYASCPSSRRLLNSSVHTTVPAVNLKRAFSSMNPHHYNDKKHTHTTKNILPTEKKMTHETACCIKKGTKTAHGGEKNDGDVRDSFPLLPLGDTGSAPVSERSLPSKQPHVCIRADSTGTLHVVDRALGKEGKGGKAINNMESEAPLERTNANATINDDNDNSNINDENDDNDDNDNIKSNLNANWNATINDDNDDDDDGTMTLGSESIDGFVLRNACSRSENEENESTVEEAHASRTSSQPACGPHVLNYSYKNPWEHSSGISHYPSEQGFERSRHFSLAPSSYVARKAHATDTCLRTSYSESTQHTPVSHHQLKEEQESRSREEHNYGSMNLRAIRDPHFGPSQNRWEVSKKKDSWGIHYPGELSERSEFSRASTVRNTNAPRVAYHGGKEEKRSVFFFEAKCFEERTRRSSTCLEEQTRKSSTCLEEHARKSSTCLEEHTRKSSTCLEEKSTDTSLTTASSDTSPLQWKEPIEEKNFRRKARDDDDVPVLQSKGEQSRSRGGQCRVKGGHHDDDEDCDNNNHNNNNNNNNNNNDDEKEERGPRQLSEETDNNSPQAMGLGRRKSGKKKKRIVTARDALNTMRMARIMLSRLRQNPRGGEEGEDWGVKRVNVWEGKRAGNGFSDDITNQN